MHKFCITIHEYTYFYCDTIRHEILTQVYMFLLWVSVFSSMFDIVMQRQIAILWGFLDTLVSKVPIIVVCVLAIAMNLFIKVEISKNARTY